MASQVSQKVESAKQVDGSVTPVRASPSHSETLISLNNWFDSYSTREHA
jgi:hypothetical protein